MLDIPILPVSMVQMVLPRGAQNCHILFKAAQSASHFATLNQRKRRPKAGFSSRGVCDRLRSASPSQQRPDAVQLAVRDPQALPELHHAASPAARLHAELLQLRREPLRAPLSDRLRAVSRMAQAADLQPPPAGAFDHFDLYFLHRRASLYVERVGRRRCRAGRSAAGQCLVSVPASSKTLLPPYATWVLRP